MVRSVIYETVGFVTGVGIWTVVGVYTEQAWLEYASLLGIITLTALFVLKLIGHIRTAPEGTDEGTRDRD